MNEKKSAKSCVRVFGATGHMGRFVIAELTRRGIASIAIARDARALFCCWSLRPWRGVRRQRVPVDTRA
jgi:short subunit dehydrogenase-like uncharacterized protein